METRFILPVALAATFHTFVLFGVNWDHIPTPPITKIRTVILDPPPPPAPEEETPVVSNESGGPKGENRVPPQIDEPPPMDGPGIQVPYEPVHPGLVDPRAKIPTTWNNPFDGGSGPGKGPNVISVIKLDNHPRATAQVPPLYPSEMKRQGIEGSVLVEFIVDETGHVTNPHVVKTSDPAFDEATLRAVANWRFEPGRKNNHTVRFRMALPVDFKLNR